MWARSARIGWIRVEPVGVWGPLTRPLWTSSAGQVWAPEGGGEQPGGRGGPGKADLVLGRHVRQALANGEPVVALESTLITHGLPEPQNLRLARELERLVWGARLARDEPGGATPATVAIVCGQAVVGVDEDELAYLAAGTRSRPIKASRRDIPVALARGQSAGCTVAATLALAASVGRWQVSRGGPIKVFASGGMGGVQAGGQLSMDVSADLYELARSPLALVASGFKSFLDAGRSLEYLETLGCTVMSLGQQAGFPAFFRGRHQRVRSPCPVRDLPEAAAILWHCLASPLAERRGALLAVPIPDGAAPEAEQLERLEQLERQLVQQVESPDFGMPGAQKTPFILAKLNEASKGLSLEANLALLRNNASLGAQLALELATIENRTVYALRAPILHETGAILDRPAQSRHNNNDSSDNSDNAKLGRLDGLNGANWAFGSAKEDRQEKARHSSESPGVVVVGCTMVDMHVSCQTTSIFKNEPKHSGVTFAGEPHLTLGGVGRNLAAALHLLGHRPLFITSLARDNLAQFALAKLANLGPQVESQPAEGSPTGAYLDAHRAHSSHSLSLVWAPNKSSCFALVLIDSECGQCECVIANLEAATAIDEPHIRRNLAQIKRSPLLVMDANLASETMHLIAQLCHTYGLPIFLEPTDVMALKRLVAWLAGSAGQPELSSLLCLSPNLLELATMLDLFGTPLGNGGPEAHNCHQWPLTQVERAAHLLMTRHLPQLTCLLVTMDQRGVLAAVRSAQPEGADLGQVQVLQCRGQKGQVRTKHYPAPTLQAAPKSASGSGDSFAAGFISGLLRQLDLDQCISLGLMAAKLSLNSKDTIPETLANLRDNNLKQH